MKNKKTAVMRSAYRGNAYLCFLWVLALMCASYLVYTLRVVARFFCVIMLVVHTFAAYRNYDGLKRTAPAGGRKHYGLVITNFGILVFTIVFAISPPILPIVKGIVCGIAYTTILILQLKRLTDDNQQKE